MQDPLNRLIVYAGTTEGLYKTEDGGEAWTRLTGPDVIINDVFVDPRNDQHLLLATDRSGVLESEDGGQTFQASNTGFSQRQVESLLLDRKAPATIYAGVLNDKIYGGVFVSQDGGNSWQQRSDGLAGADVFTLGQADDGTVFAGTGHGVFRWDGSRWQPAGQVIIVTDKKVRVRVKPGAHRAEPAPAPAPVAAVQEIAPAPVPASAPAKTTWTPVYHPVGRGPKSPARPQPKTRTQPRPRVVYAGKAPAWETVNHETFTKGGVIDARVNELSLTGATWYVATSSGLYRSADQGQNWQGPVNGAADVRFVDAADQTVVAASPESLDFSSDGGKSWTQVKLPEKLTRIRALAVAADQSVWIGGLEGLFYTEDHGRSWKAIANLPLGAISGLSYDPDLKRVLVTSGSSTIIFGVDGTDSRWKWWDAGWKVHEVYSKNGRLVGASLYDGIVVEPEPSAGTSGGSR
jgi:photosystem II stability/assembly factor-like uncharacterized protein